MKLIFLDMDGVMNDHDPHMNGYCGVKAECVAALNGLLKAVPDAKLVISSAWRYLVLNGDMTLKGFESMLMFFGVDCRGLLHGVTVSDEETCGVARDWEYLQEHGCEIRAKQIESYLARHPVSVDGHVVFDDLELPVKNLVLTAGGIGLTRELAEKAAAILTGEGGAR